jgi:hypothetical protein
VDLTGKLIWHMTAADLNKALAAPDAISQSLERITIL